MQARNQHLLEINQKDFGVHWPLHQKRSIHLLVAQGSDKCGSLPMTMRHRTQAAFAAPTAAIQTSQFGIQPRFINKDQTADIPRGLLVPPKGPRPFNVGPILLGGARRFFYNSTPNDAADATGQ